MLQIISGGFFGEGRIEQRECDAVLYSNLGWFAPIKTAVAELRPVDHGRHAVSSFVLRYTNRHQPLPVPNPVLLLANADEAVDQFRVLASFWFRAFFHPDRRHVELLCRAGPRNTLDGTVPRSFVPHFFEPGRKATPDEIAGFVQFIAKVLAMPRGVRSH